MMHKRRNGVKIRDRWLASKQTVSKTSDSDGSRGFSGGRSMSVEKVVDRRSFSRSRSRSTSGSNQRASSPKTRRKRKSRQSSSESRDSSDSGRDLIRRRKKKKIYAKLDRKSSANGQIYKLRDMVEIIGHPQQELNGVCGLLEYWVAGKKVWIVRVAGNFLKQTLKIKPEFMKKVTAEEAKVAIEKIKESKEKQKSLNALIKSRMRTGLKKAKSKDEETKNARAKAKVEAEFVVQVKHDVNENLNTETMDKMIPMKPPLVETTGIVLRKPTGENELGQQPPQAMSNSYPPYQQYPAPYTVPYMGRVFPPPILPYGMPPGVSPYLASPWGRPVVETGSRPLITGVPIEKPPIKSLVTNFDEENMDQGDSDDDVCCNGPTAPPPKLTDNLCSVPVIPQHRPILGAPPMKPPTPANITGPIQKRRSRFDVNVCANLGPNGVGSNTPVFQMTAEDASNQVDLATTGKATSESLSHDKDVGAIILCKEDGSLLSPEQRRKMAFGFKAMKALHRPKRKKIVFTEEKPELPKEVKNTEEGNISLMETPLQKIEEPTKNVAVEDWKKTESTGEGITKDQEEGAKENTEPKVDVEGVIMERVNQLKAKAKVEGGSRKKVEDITGKDSRSKSRDKSRSLSRSSRSRCRSRSYSRSLSRRRRRGRSYSSDSRSSSKSRSRRSASSRSYSRSSSYTSKSRSRRRRRRRRSSSYSTSSSSY